jgi:tight adherence protein B
LDPLYILFIGLAFLASVMFLEGLYLAWNAYRGPEARRIERRLQIMAAGTSVDTESAFIRKRLLSDLPVLDRLLLRLPRVHVLDRFLSQSGFDLTVAGFLSITLLLGVASAGTGISFGLPAPVLAALALLPAVLLVAFLSHRRGQRMQMIDRQLPDMLDLMARAMQAGHAFSSALRLVGSEGPQPIAQEFQTVFEEINFGIPSDQALEHLSSRISSNDLRYFVVAVLIQRETGGNLAEILSGIAALIRERQKLLGTVRVLSAESRVSAWILTLLPFLLAAAITVVNPVFISLLWTDPMGRIMVGGAAVLMAFGIWWMWRLVKIRI